MRRSGRFGREGVFAAALAVLLGACFVFVAAPGGDSAGAPTRDFTFVQISDTHIGFSNAPNKDPGGTLREAIDRINAMPVAPDFVIHTGDLSNLSKPEEWDSLDVMLRGLHAATIYYVPGEHDVIPDNGKLFFSRYAPKAEPGGWYSFDYRGVHFVGLVNVVNRPQTGFGHLGEAQLAWLSKDLGKIPVSTPVVVFTHIPLWTVYEPWGWGTDDGDKALASLKRFERVTILNGHIHQIQHSVIGNATLQTARSTAYPQPPPDPANHPGPWASIQPDQLRGYLGIREVRYAATSKAMTITDTPLAAPPPTAVASRDPDTLMIRIDDDKFIPDTITVPVGTIVRWVNVDDEVHTVMSADSSFTKAPQPLDTNGAFAYTFEKAGTYGYYCSIHPFMKGTVIVK